MPDCVDEYTKYIYPLKLHEYLASGRPVVSFRIRSLARFAEFVMRTSTHDEWSQAIAKSLTASVGSTAQVEIRRNIARKHDWDILVERIARTLCQRLGPTYIDRFNWISAKDSLGDLVDTDFADTAGSCQM